MKELPFQRGHGRRITTITAPSSPSPQNNQQQAQQHPSSSSSLVSRHSHSHSHSQSSASATTTTTSSLIASLKAVFTTISSSYCSCPCPPSRVGACCIGGRQRQRQRQRRHQHQHHHRHRQHQRQRLRLRLRTNANSIHSIPIARDDPPPIRLNRLHGVNKCCISSLSPHAYIQFERTAPAYRTALFEHLFFSLQFHQQQTQQQQQILQAQTASANMSYRLNSRRRFMRTHSKHSEIRQSSENNDHHTASPPPSQDSDPASSQNNQPKFVLLRGYGRHFHKPSIHWTERIISPRRPNSWDIHPTDQQPVQPNSYVFQHPSTTTQSRPPVMTSTNFHTTTSHTQQYRHVQHHDHIHQQHSNNQNITNYMNSKTMNKNKPLHGVDNTIPPPNVPGRSVSLSPSDELLALREALRAMERGGRGPYQQQQAIQFPPAPKLRQSNIRTTSNFTNNNNTNDNFTPLRRHPGRPDRTRTDDRNRPNRNPLSVSLLDNVREAQMKSPVSVKSDLSPAWAAFSDDNEDGNINHEFSHAVMNNETESDTYTYMSAMDRKPLTRSKFNAERSMSMNMELSSSKLQTLSTSNSTSSTKPGMNNNKDNDKKNNVYNNIQNNQKKYNFNINMTHDNNNSITNKTKNVLKNKVNIAEIGDVTTRIPTSTSAPSSPLLTRKGSKSSRSRRTGIRGRGAFLSARRSDDDGEDYEWRSTQSADEVDGSHGPGVSHSHKGVLRWRSKLPKNGRHIDDAINDCIRNEHHQLDPPIRRLSLQMPSLTTSS